jgi:hypothetical protein
MKAFFFANNTSQSLVSSDGRRLVGTINSLEPGAYIVIAKASVGTNVASGYPPPAYPYSAGVLTLSFGGATDLAYVGVLPESGQNNENLTIMVAAETGERRDAHLYFQALYPLRTVVNSARLVALQVDELSIEQEGAPPEDPDRDADEARSMLLKAILTEPSSAALMTDLLRARDDG